MLVEDLYKIEQFNRSQDNIEAQLHINASHNIFEGHFPEHPILPGVCIIQIIKELTEKFLEQSLFLANCTNAKFFAPINPNENPIINIKIEVIKEENIKIKGLIFSQNKMAVKLSLTFKAEN